MLAQMIMKESAVITTINDVVEQTISDILSQETKATSRDLYVWVWLCNDELSSWNPLDVREKVDESLRKMCNEGRVVECSKDINSFYRLPNVLEKIAHSSV